MKKTRLFILSSILLSTLIVISPVGPIAKAYAMGSTVPLLKGWGGVGVAESDQNTTGPPSTVFSGEHASNMEQAFANLTSKGLNAERVLFYNPLNTTRNNIMVTNGVGVFNYTDTRLNRAFSIAQHFGVWLVLNEHQICDWANATVTCQETFGNAVITFTNVQSTWLSFWQNNVSRIALNSDYSNFMYEPLNEPNVTNTIINGQHQGYPGSPVNLVGPYEAFINMIRNTKGDTSHYIIASNAESDGDFPVLTDSAGLLMLTRHFYFQFPNYKVPSGWGASYQANSYSGWGITNGQKFADNVTNYMRAAQAHFQWPVITTESGADWLSDTQTPPDVVLGTSSCRYSQSNAAFIQQLVNDFSKPPALGYQLWMNGDWNSFQLHSIYGCLSVWGAPLNYHSLPELHKQHHNTQHQRPHHGHWTLRIRYRSQ